MDLVWIWAVLIALSIFYIAFAIYQLATKGKQLVAQTKKLQKLIQDSLADIESAVTPAKATTEEDLVGLMKQRRAMSKEKLAQKAKRQRRLIARIRDIEIDKRFL